jgi:hypothetical protein
MLESNKARRLESLEARMRREGNITMDEGRGTRDERTRDERMLEGKRTEIRGLQYNNRSLENQKIREI